MEQLHLRGLDIRYPGSAAPVLSGLSLSVGGGECHCIVGPTGSGKSSLLRAVAGLAPTGATSGELRPASRPGVVLQNPHTQILRDHVGPEAAFALENLCIDPEAMPGLVTRALNEADLRVPTHTITDSLSMGRRYRLVLAGALVAEPDLLLLDEPCAQLDPEGCAAVGRVINRVRARGGGVLLCEHDPTPLAGSITHWWRLENGALVPSSPIFSTQAPPVADGVLVADPPASPGALLEVRALHLSLGARPILAGLDLTVRPGEAVHLEGPNGSGKTTLTRVLSGFLAPDSGEATLSGRPLTPAQLRGRVGLVLQNPLGQLFEDTVLKELSFAARRKGLADPESHARQVAEGLGIAHLIDRAPHLLSYGQQRLTALGACLTQQPELLILDDPFAGLDRDHRECIRKLLLREREERSMAVLVTGHNPPSSLRFPDFYTRQLRLDGGRLAPVA